MEKYKFELSYQDKYRWCYDVFDDNNHIIGIQSDNPMDALEGAIDELKRKGNIKHV